MNAADPDTNLAGLSGLVVVVFEIIIRREVGYWMDVHCESHNASPDWIFRAGVRKHMVAFTIQIYEHDGRKQLAGFSESHSFDPFVEIREWLRIITQLDEGSPSEAPKEVTT